MIIKLFYLILILILAFSTVPVINSQQTCIQPVSGMVSWCSGDGDSEDFYNINHGILYKGTSLGFGKVWQAFSFDGVDDYLLAPGEGINDLQQITIEGWVYLNSLPNRIMRFVTCSPPNIERAVIRYCDFNNYAGQLHFYMRIGDETADFTHLLVQNVLFSETWHHFAGTYDGQFMRLYLDGVELAFQEISGPIAIEEAFQDHGVMFSSPDEPLDGLLDEISIYNRALSASEIQAIYAADSSGKCRPRKMICTGTMTITESKEGNVTVSTDSICTIASDIHINGYVKVLDGGVLNVQGEITGDLIVNEGTLLVDGNIDGNLEVLGDSQVKVDGGIIDGFVNASSLGAAGAEIYLGPTPSSVGGASLQTLLVLDGPVNVKGNITHIGNGLGVEFRSSNVGSVLVEGSIILHGTGQEVDITSGTGHIVKGNIECDKAGAVDPDDWDGDPGVVNGEIIIFESTLDPFLIGGGLSAIIIIGVVVYIVFRRKQVSKTIL